MDYLMTCSRVQCIQISVFKSNIRHGSVMANFMKDGGATLGYGGGQYAGFLGFQHGLPPATLIQIMVVYHQWHLVKH